MTRKGIEMDRQRFDHLLDAYGADFARWPTDERQVAAAFAVAHADELAGTLRSAEALDAALDAHRGDASAPELLNARILAAHRRAHASVWDWRAAAALAACAVFGIVLGYGGGLMAPLPNEESDYFATVFESPLADFDGDEG